MKKRVLLPFIVIIFIGILFFRNDYFEKQNAAEQNFAEQSFFAQKKTEEGTEVPSFLEAESTEYAYSCLSEAEKIWYQDIKQILGNMETEKKLSQEGLKAGMDETNIDDIFQCVLNDHPELFYVEGYTYTKYTLGEKLITLEFSGAYSVDMETALLRKAEIQEQVQPLLNGISKEASDYEKIKYVYETIIWETEYNLNASDNQNIYSVFVNHASVCQGYAEATKYLLDRLGVECALVQGTVDTGEGHAWNLVKADGSYYYIDTTWGDASYRTSNRQESSGNQPDINYDYLCITTEQLLRTHILGGYVPMPECTDIKNNYYVREGAYFTDFNKEQIRQLFEKASETENGEIAIKCADITCYQEIKTALIDHQEIFEYLPKGIGTISFGNNEKQLSLTFWVTNE